MKSIYETLAALGAGAILLAGCGGNANEQVKTPETPMATETTPAAENKTEQTSGTDAAGTSEETKQGDAKPEGSAAEAPAKDAVASPTPAGATPAAPSTAAPATSTTAKTATKPAATTKKTATVPKKKDAAGSCGEGTCG